VARYAESLATADCDDSLSNGQTADADTVPENKGRLQLAARKPV